MASILHSLPVAHKAAGIGDISRPEIFKANVKASGRLLPAADSPSAI